MNFLFRTLSNTGGRVKHLSFLVWTILYSNQMADQGKFLYRPIQLTNKDRRIELVSHPFQPLMDLDSDHQWLLTSWRGTTTHYVPSNRNTKQPLGSSHTNTKNEHESKWTSRSNYWFTSNRVGRGTRITPARGCNKQNPDRNTLQSNQPSFLNK